MRTRNAISSQLGRPHRRLRRAIGPKSDRERQRAERERSDCKIGCGAVAQRPGRLLHQPEQLEAVPRGKPLLLHVARHEAEARPSPRKDRARMPSAMVATTHSGSRQSHGRQSTGSASSGERLDQRTEGDQDAGQQRAAAQVDEQSSEQESKHGRVDVAVARDLPDRQRMPGIGSDVRRRLAEPPQQGDDGRNARRLEQQQAQFHDDDAFAKARHSEKHGLRHRADRS